MVRNQNQCCFRPKPPLDLDIAVRWTFTFTLFEYLRFEFSRECLTHFRKRLRGVYSARLRVQIFKNAKM